MKPAPYKVVRVITRMNVGGPSIHVAILARHFAPPRAETVVAHGALPAGEASMADLLDGTGARVEFLPALGKSIRPWNDLAALAALWRLLRRERPEIVHTHHAKAGALGRVAAWLAGVPVRIHTFHGNVFRGHYGPAASRLWVVLERLLARISTRLVAISGVGRRDLVEVFRVAPPAKVATIPLGFDLGALREARPGGFRRAHGIDEAAPLVGIFGRLTAVKDHALFLDAAERVVAARPDVRFVVAGGGESEAAVRADLERRPALRDAVRMIGFVRPMAPALAETDVVVLTSKSEGTPVSVIEAMAAGRAVVATAVGGVVDVVEDGRTGLLVRRAGEDAAGRAATAEALAEAIVRLVDDAGLRERLGAAAREAAVRWDAGRLCADLERLYALCLEEAGIDR